MTPREVQLSIRASSEIRLDHMDELILAAWRGALWSRPGVKLPEPEDALIARRKRKEKPRTLEEDVRRWERFFARVGKERAN